MEANFSQRRCKIFNKNEQDRQKNIQLVFHRGQGRVSYNVLWQYV